MRIEQKSYIDLVDTSLNWDRKKAYSQLLWMIIDILFMIFHWSQFQFSILDRLGIISNAITFYSKYEIQMKYDHQIAVTNLTIVKMARYSFTKMNIHHVFVCCWLKFYRFRVSSLLLDLLSSPPFRMWVTQLKPFAIVTESME